MPTAHHHAHGHGEHGHNHAQANEYHFDAHGIDLLASEEGKEIGRQAAKAFLESYKYDKEGTKVLDFACGVGNVSINMVQYVKSILGVDISGKMVGYYNEVVKKEGLEEKMSALRVDVIVDPSPLEGKMFDVIVCSLSYHHFTSPHSITSALSKYLAPSGALLIIDFTPVANGVDIHPGLDEESYKHYVAHKSFSEEDMRGIYEAGGMGIKKYEYAFNMNWKGFKRDCFIAVGVKN